MPLRAKIAGALLVCTILSACQSSGSGGSNGLSTTPTSGPANPVGLQQCQAITASPATTTTIASPTAPPVSGDTQASLVLVPEGAHSLGVYLRNPWTGALIDRGYVATGQTPSAVAVSGGQFVYVANTTDGTISAYSWQPSQAQLAALGLGGTNTISSGPGVSSLAVVGHYLYALNTGDSSITTFSIDSGNGALTLVNTIGTPALTTLAPGTNGLLYGIGNTEIVTYSAGSGSPATMWTTTGLTGILTAAANSVGNLYVLTNTSVEAFSPAGNGRLGSQDRVGLPDGLTPAAITAGNGQVNVVGDGSNTSEIVTFPLIAGAIACPTSAVLGTSGQTNAASVSPGGHYVYVTNATNSELLAYTATTMGSGPQLTDNVRTRLTPRAIASLIANVTVSPQTLYVVNQSANQIAGYAVAPNGALVGATPFTGPSTCNPCANSNLAQGPSVITVAPNGQNLYASDWEGDVTTFGIQTDGSLNNLDGTATGISPMGVAVDPSDRYLYVANSCYENATGGNCGGTISSYSLSQGLPTLLTNTPTVSTALYPMLLTIDPTGRYLYVAQYAANSIGLFSIDPDTGVLTSLGSAPSGPNPWSAVVGPSGRHLYVSDNSLLTGGVSIYAIAAATGALTPAITSSAVTLPISGKPLGLVIGPKGRRLYVATQGGALDVFIRTDPLAIGSSWNTTPLAIPAPATGTFMNAYGLAIANNGKALYVVDNCTQPNYNNGSVQELAIPPFGQGLNPASYVSLGIESTGYCSVEAVPGGGLG